MNKKGLIFLIATILILVTLSGCVSPINETDEKENQSLTEVEPLETTFLHGNESGLWFMLSSGIVETVNRTYPGSIVNVTPGSNISNILRINDYQAEFGFTHSNIAFEAINALDDFPNKNDNIRHVATLYPSVAQFVLKEDLGIDTMEEFFNLKPKARISIGSVGGTSPITFNKLIETYGYTLEDLELWGCKIEYKSQTDASKMMADGALDGIFMVASAPNPVISEQSVNNNFNMIQIDDATISKLIEEFAFSAAKISKNAYNFIDKDISSFSTQTILIASDKASDEDVYKMVRSIYENLEYLKSIHASLEELSPEYLTIDIRIPIHPGAERFYKEVGLLD